MSVILTLMRTSASMIEVKVSSSVASAMLPRSKRFCDTTKPPFFWGKARGRLSVVPRESNPGPWLVNRYYRFAVGCFLCLACAVAHTLMRTRWFRDACLEAASRLVGEEGRSDVAVLVLLFLQYHILMLLQDHYYNWPITLLWCHSFAPPGKKT